MLVAEIPELQTGQVKFCRLLASQLYTHLQLDKGYQYKCPQLVTTGSVATSKQMLHSYLLRSLCSSSISYCFIYENRLLLEKEKIKDLLMVFLYKDLIYPFGLFAIYFNVPP